MSKVEWKFIGDICYISDYVSNGSFASLRENVQYKSEPDYAILIRFADYSNGFDESKFVYVDEHAYKFLAKSELKSGDIIMSNVGSCGLYFICPNLDRKMSLAPNSILIRSEYNRYFNHWFGSYQGSEDIKKITSKSAMPKFNKTEFKKIQVPVPSQEEMEKIVSALDTFTSSIENLKEQIALRRKQYEYYRDQLLDLEGKDGAKNIKLENIVSQDCSLSYGIVQPGDDVFEGVPVVRPVDLITTFVNRKGLKNTTKQISDSYKRTILKGNEILFCVRGTTGVMSLATQSLVGCNVTRGIVPISFDNEITKMFVYYQLKSRKLQKVIADKTNGTALKQINVKDLRQINLIIPSLSEQQRIVGILDVFEESIQNLEAQLAGREKQYEYYRNKLLTFK